MGPLALVQMREMEVSEEAVTMRSRGLSSSVGQHKWLSLHRFLRMTIILWTTLCVSQQSAGPLTMSLSLSLRYLSHILLSSFFLKDGQCLGKEMDNLQKAIISSNTTKIRPPLGQSWLLAFKFLILIFTLPFSVGQP